jgi:ATP-dependent DNA helicase RecQ
LRIPKQDVFASLDPATQRRFESLRETRLRLAKQDNLPAFCVMHDRILLEVAREAPASKPALLQISGVGDKTVEKYGDALLAAIRGSSSRK